MVWRNAYPYFDGCFAMSHKRSLPIFHHQASLAHKSLVGKRDPGTYDKTEQKEETGLAKSVSLSRPRARRESTRAQEYLLLWLDIRNNWKKWRRGDETKQDERKASRGIVTAVLQLGLDYIKEFGVTDMNPDSVKHQLEKLEDLYKDASILFGTTGEGLTLEDIRKIASLKGTLRRNL
ncbi:hypothetical protein RvY_02800-3 [Ramazzottius varieornatus]|uniref:Uncharacterized protein n=1 Tax=Ramazzottius varieornatus TaxID=947166 RepID=A0A1D1UW51_RAMVA|nr:hypothetical protein RvY_02800-3 [Ramazzottius varieornatus]